MHFLLENLIWVIVFVLSGGMLIGPYILKGMNRVAEVSSFDATRIINSKDGVLLDIRNAEEFSTGHILGAKNIPVAKLNSDLGALAKNKSKPIIVYCQNGRLSPSAVKILNAQEFKEVYALTGGLSAWQQAGLPLQKQK